ncbi:MAG: hypothetical protein LUE29_03885 [Lachnospiraceae bacterium]|nr:hypothetical protein [Lachnospiraceae bacterium]
MKFECATSKCSSRKPEAEIYENRPVLSNKSPSSLRVMEHLQKTGLQEETLYRELYMQNPSPYNTPVSSWGDFVLSWQNSTSNKLTLPELAPTPIETFFPEEGWFPDDNAGVAIVKNSRYCPPFWHSLAFVKLVYIVQGCGLLFLTDRKIKLQQGDI